MNPLAELADRQWRDYRARQPGMCFADPGFVLSLAEAYEVQDTIAKLRIAAGDRLIGYKVGCTGPGTVQQFGMQGPIRGCLFESEIRRHGDTLNFDDFAGLAIEGEMAVRIASDGTIAAAFPVIELHHFVFRGPTKTLPELVANNGLNGGIVLPYDGWLSSRKCIEGKDALSVRINGRLVASDRRPEHPPVDDRFRDDRDGMDAGVRDRLRIRSVWRAITPYGGQRGIDRVLDREVTDAAASRASQNRASERGDVAPENVMTNGYMLGTAQTFESGRLRNRDELKRYDGMTHAFDRSRRMLGLVALGTRRCRRNRSRPNP